VEVVEEKREDDGNETGIGCVSGFLVELRLKVGIEGAADAELGYTFDVDCTIEVDSENREKI